MENNQLLIPERVRQYPTLRGFDVAEAQIVSVEPFPVATEEEAPLPFIEANSAAVSWKELTEENISPSYADGEIVVPHSQFIQALVLAAHDALPHDTFGSVEIRASHLTQGRVPSAIQKTFLKRILHGMEIRDYGLGITSRSAQILSKSSRNWFDIIPVAGTRKARK